MLGPRNLTPPKHNSKIYRCASSFALHDKKEALHFLYRYLRNTVTATACDLSDPEVRLQH